MFALHLHLPKVYRKGRVPLASWTSRYWITDMLITLVSFVLSNRETPF